MRKMVLRALMLPVLTLLLASASFAQEQEAEGICFPQGGNTAVVRGFIGGESHDSYILHLKEGRQVTVRITSTRNRANFTVSTAEFGEPVAFGTETNGGRTWTGTIPQTAPYYISVVAHPQARYRLRITVK